MANDWIGNKYATFSTIGATGHSIHTRESDDFYATSPKAIDALAQANKLPKSLKVWECAAGDGSLSKTLASYGYEVTSTDLVDRGFCTGGTDFLKTKELLAPCILTNPPYNLATEFVTHSLELCADEIYMFVKLQFLEGKRRYKEIYSKNPPALILQFTERMTVARNGDPDAFNKPSAMAFYWLIWRKGFVGKPAFDWITAETL